MVKPALVQPAGLGALHLLEVLFFRRTADGGQVGWSKAKDLAIITKNKLHPIGLRLQCRMLWLCGLGDEYFNNLSDMSTSLNIDDTEPPDIHDN